MKPAAWSTLAEKDTVARLRGEDMTEKAGGVRMSERRIHIPRGQLQSEAHATQLEETPHRSDANDGVPRKVIWTLARSHLSRGQKELTCGADAFISAPLVILHEDRVSCLAVAATPSVQRPNPGPSATR